VQWLNAMIKPGGFRLPSEAEWEYAARAGSETEYPWGDNPEQAKEYAWFGDNADGKIQPVGDRRIKPNGFGLHDMTGNVLEWVKDCYAEAYSQAPKDGSAWDPKPCTEGRVLRGGSWGIIQDSLRSASRFRYFPDFRSSLIGFRLAQD